MTNETQFDTALSRALKMRTMPEPSPLFAVKLQARCVPGEQAAVVPQAGMPLYAAAGSLVMGLLIGVMLFTTLNLPMVEAAAAPADHSAILYHYIYKSAV